MGWVRTSLAFFILCFAMAFSLHAHAYRPFDGTDADVAGFGEFEAEVSPVGFLRDDAQNYILVPNVVLNLGFCRRFEVVMQTTDFVALGTHPGVHDAQLGDAGIFLKALLRRGSLQDEDGPSIAMEVGPNWPWLYPEPQLGGSAALIISMKWPNFAFHFNQEVRLGNAVGQAPGSQGLFLLQETSLILEGPGHWNVRPVLEGLIDYTSNTVSVESILGGLIWEVNETLALDAAARLGVEQGEAQYEARLGFTWIVPVWGDPPGPSVRTTNH